MWQAVVSHADHGDVGSLAANQRAHVCKPHCASSIQAHGIDRLWQFDDALGNEIEGREQHFSSPQDAIQKQEQQQALMRKLWP